MADARQIIPIEVDEANFRQLVADTEAWFATESRDATTTQRLLERWLSLRLMQPGSSYPRPPEGPGYGHQFHFTVDIQGSYRVGDGPHTDAEQPAGLPFQAVVRAWNLPDACRRAAALALGKWTLDGETALEDLPEDGS